MEAAATGDELDRTEDEDGDALLVLIAETGEEDSDSSIGQTVVEIATVLVTYTSVWLSGRAGQSVTSGAQLVVVYT